MKRNRKKSAQKPKGRQITGEINGKSGQMSWIDSAGLEDFGPKSNARSLMYKDPSGDWRIAFSDYKARFSPFSERSKEVPTYKNVPGYLVTEDLANFEKRLSCSAALASPFQAVSPKFACASEDFRLGGDDDADCFSDPPKCESPTPAAPFGKLSGAKIAESATDSYKLRALHEFYFRSSPMASLDSEKMTDFCKFMSGEASVTLTGSSGQAIQPPNRQSSPAQQ